MSTIIEMPQDLLIASASVGVARYDIVETSDSNGASNARVLGPPRWVFTLGSPNEMSSTQLSKWTTMVTKLRGRVNYLAVWDPGSRSARGTISGSLALAAPLAAWADSLILTGGSNGQTIENGSWLQIGSGVGTSQMVRVTDSGVVAGGTITLPFEHPVRQAFTAGTQVYWYYPHAYCKLAGDALSWVHNPGAPDSHGGVSISLLEQW